MIHKFYEDSKYHAQKVEYRGEQYDSRKEFRRAKELELLQKAGRIKDLQRQVKYELLPSQKSPDGKHVQERAVYYIADFVYWDNDKNILVVEDVKGVRTDVYILKRKLMLYFHHITITEY